MKNIHDLDSTFGAKYYGIFVLIYGENSVSIYGEEYSVIYGENSVSIYGEEYSVIYGENSVSIYGEEYSVIYGEYQEIKLNFNIFISKYLYQLIKTYLVRFIWSGTRRSGKPDHKEAGKPSYGQVYLTYLTPDHTIFKSISALFPNTSNKLDNRISISLTKSAHEFVFNFSPSNIRLHSVNTILLFISTHVLLFVFLTISEAISFLFRNSSIVE